MGTKRIAERDRLMKNSVTLDGHLAYLAGRLNRLAFVWRPDTLEIVSFPWDTVREVVDEKNGQFTTA